MKLPLNLRRENLLRAALKVVKERGFEHLTCREVAKAAGCSTNTAARMFGNREILAHSLINYARLMNEKEIVTLGVRLWKS